MKHTKDVEIPASSERLVVKTTCDLCGDEVKETGYNVDEVTITHRTGKCYPDSRFITEITIDLCGYCFNQKLIPWVQVQGGKPSVKEWAD